MKVNSHIPFKKGTISIQASEFHYCYPKSNNGPYSLLEVAVFDKIGNRVREDSLKKYADDDHCKDPVYGYVPKNVLYELLDKDGYTKDNLEGIFDRLD